MLCVIQLTPNVEVLFTELPLHTVQWLGAVLIDPVASLFNAGQVKCSHVLSFIAAHGAEMAQFASFFFCVCVFLVFSFLFLELLLTWYVDFPAPQSLRTSKFGVLRQVSPYLILGWEPFVVVIFV